MYNPVANLSYEKSVAYYAKRALGAEFAPDVPLKICVTAYLKIPASSSLKIKNEMLAGNMLPTKKPDCDNILKIIMDGLNGVAYPDDKLVCEAYVWKLYSDNPRVEVILESI
jgi:Holliday junction resolvase RusA-like endonuclease